MKFGSKVLLLVGIVSGVNSHVTDAKTSKMLGKATAKSVKEVKSKADGVGAKAGAKAGTKANKGAKSKSSKAADPDPTVAPSAAPAPEPTGAPSGKPTTSEPTTSSPIWKGDAYDDDYYWAHDDDADYDLDDDTAPTSMPTFQMRKTPFPATNPPSTGGRGTLQPSTGGAKDSLEPTGTSSLPPITSFPTTEPPTTKPYLRPSAGPTPSPLEEKAPTSSPLASTGPTEEPTEAPAEAPTTEEPTVAPRHDTPSPTASSGAKASKSTRGTKAAGRPLDPRGLAAKGAKLLGKSAKSSKQDAAVEFTVEAVDIPEDVADAIATVEPLTQAILRDTAATRPGKADKEETNEDCALVDVGPARVPLPFGRAKAAKRTKRAKGE